jgi:hypothetical protein
VGRQQCFHKQLMPKQGFSCKHSIDKLNTSHNSLPFLDIDCTETKHADLSLSSNEALPVSLLGKPSSKFQNVRQSGSWHLGDKSLALIENASEQFLAPLSILPRGFSIKANDFVEVHRRLMHKRISGVYSSR